MTSDNSLSFDNNNTSNTTEHIKHNNTVINTNNNTTSSTTRQHNYYNNNNTSNNINNNNIHHHAYGSSQRLAHSHHRVHHPHHSSHHNNNNIRKVMSQLSVNSSQFNNNNQYNSVDQLSSSYSNDNNINMLSINSNNNNHINNNINEKIHSAQSFSSLSSYYRDDEHHVHYFDSDEFDEHLYPPPNSKNGNNNLMVHFDINDNDSDSTNRHSHEEHELDDTNSHHHHINDIHHDEENPIQQQQQPSSIGKYHPSTTINNTINHHTMNTMNTNTNHNMSVSPKLLLTDHKSPQLIEHEEHVASITTHQHNSSLHENRKSTLKQYFQREYLGFEQNIIKRSDKHRDNQYRSQLELITAIDEHCNSVLNTYTSFRIFILSLMGGIFVSIGTLLSGLISSDITTKSMQKFMIGIAFVGAFTMIIFSKSILFTEVNISVSVHLFKNDLIGIIRRSIYWLFSNLFTCFKNHLHVKIRRPHKSIKLITLLNSIKLWTIAIFGNILGTILMSAILSGSYVWYDNQSVIQFLSSTTKHKIHLFEERGVNGWFSCLLSGMVANFMIGVATLLCSSGTTIIGKIIALFFPIIAFAALGVQHAPANVGYFSHIFIWDSMYGATAISNLTITPEINYVMNEIQWYESIYWNLIPAAIGNALGAFFLAFIFVFIFVK